VRLGQPDFPKFVVVHAESAGDVEELVAERDFGRVEGILHVLGQFCREGRAEVEAVGGVVVALVQVGYKGCVFYRATQDRETLCLVIQQGMGHGFADVLRLKDDPLAGFVA
jgi:hypothetical protein